MPYFNASGVAVRGIATAVPTKATSSVAYAERFGAEFVAKFQRMTGINEVRVSVEGQTASDLGFAAADYLVTEEHVNRDEIGALVFVSHSPDYRRPATACVLQKRLELTSECVAFDVSLGCSAYVYGLQILTSLMAGSTIRYALLITAETVTKLVGPNDSSTRLLFGDAGSATLLERTDDAPPIDGLLRSDGNGFKSIIAPAGGFRNMYAPKEPANWPDGNEKTLYNLHMDGSSVFTFTITEVPKSIKEFMEHVAVTPTSFDALVLHQANKLIVEKVARKTGFEMDRCPISIDRYGNTSAASIPLTICDAFAEVVASPLRLLCCGFGVGLSWGVASFTVSSEGIYPIIESDVTYPEGVIHLPN